MTYYLVSWLWVEGSTPLCICKSMAYAKQVVQEKLGETTPDWLDGDSFSTATLNIVHQGATLQGVMIQKVPLYE